jgi:hypothetical protein
VGSLAPRVEAMEIDSMEIDDMANTNDGTATL